MNHEISDLGQTLTSINKEYPNVFNILSKNGIKVEFLDHYKFIHYLRLDNLFLCSDTFAAGMSVFQTII